MACFVSGYCYRNMGDEDRLDTSLLKVPVGYCACMGYLEPVKAMKTAYDVVDLSNGKGSVVRPDWAKGRNDMERLTIGRGG